MGLVGDGAGVFALPDSWPVSPPGSAAAFTYSLGLPVPRCEPDLPPDTHLRLVACRPFLRTH